MSTATVNGVRLFYELTGEAGPPLVFVHGSWGDHTIWHLVVPALAERCRVLVYDRRGHGQSEQPPGQGSAEEDAVDLAALIAHLGLVPAHVVGTSSGAKVALRLAIRHPDLVRSLAIHEPPLLDLPLDDPADARAVAEVKERLAEVATRLEAGDMEGGARDFFDTVAFAPGTWDTLPPERQRLFVAHAPTFLDETRDRERGTLDLGALAAFRRPVLLTHGEQCPSFYAPIVFRVAAALPQAETHVIAGASHAPYRTAPDDYVAIIASFVEAAPEHDETGSRNRLVS
jgi:pimeloyl-ACP methyl ester carboxylesterase